MSKIDVIENPVRLSPAMQEFFPEYTFEHELPRDIVLNNLQACDRVLENMDRFPNADFDYISRKQEELFVFCACRLWI